MKFSLALSHALFASSAFAGLAQRRANRLRKSNPSDREAVEATSTNNTDVEYSSNWSGAVLTAPPAGSTFTAVSATFTVPTPSGGDGAASAWVGIDGDTYSSAILQTGVDFYISYGQVTYDCWYEWYPDYAYNFDGIPISGGNVISISVVSSGAAAGKVVINNLSTGKTVTKSLTAPSASSHLGGQNAEWIVEDFEQGGGLVTFANFGTVTFINATATTSTGTVVGPALADILDIKQDNKVLTKVTSSNSTVTVSHT